MAFRNGTVSPLKTHENLVGIMGTQQKKNPAPFVGAGFQIGSPSRTRTSDPVVNSHLLYQLSYWGTSFGKKLNYKISHGLTSFLYSQEGN